MSGIGKIDIIKPDAGLKPGRKAKESPVEGKSFENQLLTTVRKLETLGNEVDAMLESVSSQSGAPVTNRSQTDTLVSKKVETIVENFSAAKKASSRSAKYVAAQYGQIAVNKRS